MKVYLLTHFRNDEELDGFKTIGVFSSEEKVKEAIERLKAEPGFRDYPDNFNIGGYEIDKIFWVGGFGFE
jgi:homoserine kinase type II